MSDFEVVVEKQSAPEGPTVGPNGWILNVCSFDPATSAWTARGGDVTATHPDIPGSTHRLLTTSFAGVVGIPAALAFGPDGALYVADEGWRAVLRCSAEGTIEPWVDTWDGGPLNGPNDLVFDSDGTLYFTDPWGSSLSRPIGQVFMCPPGSRRPSRIAAGLAFPNGIAIADRSLFVAETLTNMIWRWSLGDGGPLGQPELFARCPDIPGREVVGPDGLAATDDGYVLVAHLGSGDILVYGPNGALEDRMATGGPKATNLCFGGDGLHVLFVTQEDLGAVLRRRVSVSGRRLNFCPSGGASAAWSDRLPPVRSIDRSAGSPPR